MRRRLAAVVGVFALAACADLVGAPGGSLSLEIVPEFGNLAVFARNANRLHLVVQRDSAGTFKTVRDTTVAIDRSTGEANATFTVVVLQNPTVFRVSLEAIRSSDSVVLFTGTQTVSVSGTSGTGGTPISIPVTYGGPRGSLLLIMPKDTGVAAGAQFTFHAVVRDTTGASVGEPVTFDLVKAADSTKLTVAHASGAAVVAAGITADSARVYAHSPTGLADTATVYIGSVAAGVVIAPGYADLAVGGTTTLKGQLVDAGGNPVSGPAITWTSRTPATATVSSAGVVTGVAAGTARVVATSGTFKDSALVTVPTAGNVVVSAVADGRGFRNAAVGDTVVVAVTADMAFTPSELLGSYNATLTWDPARLQFVDVQNGATGWSPTVNSGSAASGQLRFSAANATGTGGAVTVANVRFIAKAAGSGNLALAISELSAAQTFTNLLSRVTVTNGAVTVH